MPHIRLPKFFDMGNASQCLRNDENVLITSDCSWSVAVPCNIIVYLPFPDFPLFHLASY